MLIKGRSPTLYQERLLRDGGCDFVKSQTRNKKLSRDNSSILANKRFSCQHSERTREQRMRRSAVVGHLSMLSDDHGTQIQGCTWVQAPLRHGILIALAPSSLRHCNEIKLGPCYIWASLKIIVIGISESHESGRVASGALDIMKHHKSQQYSNCHREGLLDETCYMGINTIEGQKE